MSTPRHPSQHDRDRLTTAALRTLDAAPPAPLTPEQRERADDRLARILATAPRSDHAPARGPRSRVGPRALLLVAAAVALALVVSVTGVLGGGTAYASWTARPTMLPSAEQEEVAQTCRAELATGATGMDGSPSAEQLLATDLVLADTRGEHSYVVLSGADGLEATCLIERSSAFGLFGRSGSVLGSYGFVAPPTPADDRIVGTGLMAMSGEQGSAWSTEGHVGADVERVTVITDSGTEVDTTVTNGRFAAWWPERVGLDSSPGDDPLLDVRYVVTLRDGTVLPAQTYDEIAPVAEEE